MNPILYRVFNEEEEWMRFLHNNWSPHSEWTVDTVFPMDFYTLELTSKLDSDRIDHPRTYWKSINKYTINFNEKNNEFSQMEVDWINCGGELKQLKIRFELVPKWLSSLDSNIQAAEWNDLIWIKLKFIRKQKEDEEV